MKTWVQAGTAIIRTSDQKQVRLAGDFSASELEQMACGLADQLNARESQQAEQQERLALRREAARQVFEKHGEFEVGWGTRDCSQSPTRRCVYNEDADPCHDSCLYCDLPHDRR